MTGYSAIGLHMPKNPINVGAVMRAAGCFGASMVAISGRRFKRVPSDVHATWKRIPVLSVDDLHTVIPYDCVPVAVDLVDDAVALESFVHPKRAFYVFGGEDLTLGDRVLSWCKHRVKISAGCMNLAMSVNVVLYDRNAKEMRHAAV
jgi:tRNA(Leu) C34 or U34 (ribose-2'-O)-methylase TrmL